MSDYNIADAESHLQLLKTEPLGRSHMGCISQVAICAFSLNGDVTSRRISDDGTKSDVELTAEVFADVFMDSLKFRSWIKEALARMICEVNDFLIVDGCPLPDCLVDAAQGILASDSSVI